jgi:hypothetical protein
MSAQQETSETASTYPADLTPELQATLAELADLETQYEIDREIIERTTGPEEKVHLLDRLERRHRAEREPLVQHLAELQQAMMFALMRRAWVARPEDAGSRFEVEVDRTGDGRPTASERST